MSSTVAFSYCVSVCLFNGYPVVSSINYIDSRKVEGVYHVSLLLPFVNSLLFSAIRKTHQYYNRKHKIILCKGIRIKKNRLWTV